MEFEFQSGLTAWAPRNEYRAAPERRSDAATAPVEELPMRSQPRWIRLEQAILKALLPFTEARDAVARALSEIEPELEPAT